MRTHVKHTVINIHPAFCAMRPKCGSNAAAASSFGAFAEQKRQKFRRRNDPDALFTRKNKRKNQNQYPESKNRHRESGEQQKNAVTYTRMYYDLTVVLKLRLTFTSAKNPSLLISRATIIYLCVIFDYSKA